MFSFEREIENDIISYKISGELLLNQNEEFGEQIKADIKQGYKKFLFDAEDLLFMDSSAFGLFAYILRSKAIMKVVFDKKVDENSTMQMFKMLFLDFESSNFCKTIEQAKEELKEAKA